MGRSSAALLTMLLVPLLGQAAAIGNAFGTHITGTVEPGDYERVVDRFAKGFPKGLQIKIDADSRPFETMRIGLWLRERKPALDVLRNCVGPCASFILTSGASVRIEGGLVIAFNTRPEWEAMVRDRVQAGALSGDEELGQISKAHLLGRFKDIADKSALMREATDSLIPAPALKFLRELTLPDELSNVQFDEERYNFHLSMSEGRCMWWVPDAEGLRQLGIGAPGYQPASREAAAKLLKVAPTMIYIGPALDKMPEQGLCTAPEAPKPQ